MRHTLICRCKIRHTLISQRELLARWPPPTSRRIKRSPTNPLRGNNYGGLNNHDGAVATINENARLPPSNFGRILAAEMGLSVFPRLVAVQHEQFTVCLCSLVLLRRIGRFRSDDGADAMVPSAEK